MLLSSVVCVGLKLLIVYMVNLITVVGFVCFV